MNDDREIVKKKAWEIIERARRNGYPPIAETTTSAEINKPDSLSEMIKTQEQADFLRKMIKMLREEEKK